MIHDSHGLHHLHKRKRIHQKHEPYPHPDKVKNFVDRAVYFVAMIGPVMTLPQIYKIWVFQNAAGVSLVSWAAYLFCACFWLWYGLLHKEGPIIFSNSVWIVLEIIIVVGVLRYGSGLL